MTTVEHPTLDGMPEPPPAWQRPDEGVRLAALDLSHMLAAALPHCLAGPLAEELPYLAAIRLTVDDGLLITEATDRYSSLRERRPVSQTCASFQFLLRDGDARALRVLLRGVLRGLEKEEKETEPVDVALEVTDDGPTLRVLGRDLDVRFTEQDGDFPDVGGQIERLQEQVRDYPARQFPIGINPTLLARVVAAQTAGRGARPFRYSCPADPDARSRPVLIEPLIRDDDDTDDDLAIAVMPVSDGAAE